MPIPLQTTSLSGFTRTELEAWFAAHSWPTFRARQVWHWFHGRSAASFDQMTDLPRDLRAALAPVLPLCTTKIAHLHTSRDSSEKRLIRLADGETTETVWIPMGSHATVCVSTQVGCPIRCVFCASGTGGLVRNLTAAEIVEQVWHAQAAHSRSAVNNLVFMGMGEPLLNCKNLISAIRIINDADGMHIGARHMTVSTIGVPIGILTMARETPQVNLAVSLHATDDALRAKLIPHRPSSIADLISALREYYAQTSRRITFEYVLLKDVNDSAAQADALGRLARRVAAQVNLIPYNEVPGAPFRASDAQRMRQFAEALEARGITAVVRRKKGDDISAACGQLRRAVAVPKNSPSKP